MGKQEFRVPTGNRTFMASPPLEEFVEGLKRRPAKLEGRCPRCGVSWEELRESATKELREGALRFTRSLGFESNSSEDAPLLLTGHQPEFFHPGVWIKNFMANALAVELGFAAVNMVVDNDAAKHTSVRVPVLAGGRATTRSVALARSAESSLAYEELSVGYLRLGEFLRELSEAVREGPLEKPVAATLELLSDEAKRAEGLVEFVTRARCKLERGLGFCNLELPISNLSGADSFRQFVSHVLSAPWDFAECYNSALERYRRENHVRGKRRPLPDLESSAESVEVPFWVWERGSARERLFVKREGKRICFSNPILGQGIPCWREGNCGEAERALGVLAKSGWKLRPRALSMTAFLRSFGSTGFVHGIGGGKYDEITDSFLSEFFGLEPLPYWVVSATLLLPFARNNVSASSITMQERLIRDCRYNPQRHAVEKGEDAAFQALVGEKFRWIGTEPTHGGEARERFENIRRANREMLQMIASDLRREEELLKQMREDLKSDAVMGNREYSFILHPMYELKEFFCEALSQMRKGSTDK